MSKEKQAEKDKLAMNQLTERIASIAIHSVNMFAREVPDSVSEHYKAQALLEAVIAKLEASV